MPAWTGMPDRRPPTSFPGAQPGTRRMSHLDIPLPGDHYPIPAVLRASVIPGNAPAPGAANGNHRRLPGKASPHPKEVFHAPGLFPRPA